MYLLFILLTTSSLWNFVLSSAGDRSFVFYKCNTRCLTELCDNLSSQQYNGGNQLSDFLKYLSQWKCDRDCKYTCMWETVDAFRNDNLPIPQFYGKWPFIRILGLEEPASVLFSILNLAVNVKFLRVFYQRARIGPPMCKFWLLQGMIAVNAWIWSTVFHSVDTSLTEKLDYFGALFYVLFSLVVLVHRALPNGLVKTTLTCAIALFAVRHFHYMAYVNFDYGYNMLVAVVCGLLFSSGWLLWSYFCCDPVKQTYIKYCRISILSMVVSMLLELNDFPPILWIFDAHSLWHGATVFVLWTWWLFVIGDYEYQSEQRLVIRHAKI